MIRWLRGAQRTWDRVVVMGRESKDAGGERKRRNG